jgi:nitrogen fixation protein FixH
MSRVRLRTRPLNGRTVLLLFVAFFAVVFAVDGVFAYFAITSWPGVARKDAYQAGLRYNETLEEARRQAALGWQSGIAVDSEGTIVVMIADADGKAIEGLDVSVTMARAVSETRDMIIALDPSGDGGYAGMVMPPLAGLWHATVVARDADGNRFRMTHEIVVRP